MKPLTLTALISLGVFLSSAALGMPRVLVSEMRIAVEPSGKNAVFVKELITLKPMGQSDLPNEDGIVIPLPKGATGAALGEEISQEGIAVKDNALHIEGNVSTAGRSVAVTFQLPIANGRAVIDQSTGAPIAEVFCALVGEVNGIALFGPGFSAAQKDDTPEGMPALFVEGKNFTNGRVSLTVDGFGKGLVHTVTMTATFVSFLVLLAGFVIWIKRRIKKDTDFST